jgi:hypothetical protein
MPNQQRPQPPKTKIEYPGDWAIFSAGAKNLGLTNDSSGEEALNEWGTTATEEEKQWLYKRAESLGFVTGLATAPLWARFWNWLFGNK